METRKYKERGYVQGSTARKLNTIPDWEYENPPLRRKEQKRSQVSHRSASWSVLSLLFMLVSIGIMLYVCISYMQVQHNVNTMSKQLAAVESEISKMKSENDAAYDKVETTIDLSYVYEVATEELGMVRAEQGQIKTYENIKSDYVRQYGEIPEENSVFSYLREKK